MKFCVGCCAPVRKEQGYVWQGPARVAQGQADLQMSFKELGKNGPGVLGWKGDLHLLC